MISIKIDVDKSQLDAFTRQMQKRNIEAAISRGVHQTGDKAKEIVTKAIDSKYFGGTGFIEQAIKPPQKQFMSCVIPIKGSKGGIGSVFGAGGSTGNVKAKGKLRKYQLKKGLKLAAKIVRGQTSILPSTMSHQGGNPPFMIGGQVVTRRTSKRVPVVRVVGLAVPQMAENRARKKIEKDLGKELQNNVTAELEKALGI